MNYKCKGEKAHHLLADSDYCGVFGLENCAMFDLGDFPGIKRRTEEHVIGEVYFTNKEAIGKIDAYEGEGTLYKRNLARAVNNSALSPVFRPGNLHIDRLV